MAKYMVVAKCDPYNARFHYNNETVLEYDMATPVKWVVDCGYGDGLSKHEALTLLSQYASEVDNWAYCDDDTIEYELEEYDLEFDSFEMEWYQGPGYYEDDYLRYRIGDEYLRIDTVLYCIEEFEEAQ
jgi:hypothetical protein